MRYDLVLGDATEDYHGICHTVTFDCNYGVEKMRQAYMDSCEKLGICFDGNNGHEHPWGKRKNEKEKEKIWVDYGDNYISEKASKILDVSGCFENVGYEDSDGERVIWEDEDRAILIMNFIALSMPEDFTYEVANEKNEKINNGWLFGYGLYD